MTIWERMKEDNKGVILRVKSDITDEAIKGLLSVYPGAKIVKEDKNEEKEKSKT